MHDPLSESEAREALQYVLPDCDRPVWFSIAGALKSEFGDAGADLFEDWSREGRSFDQADCRATWRSARPGHYTIGTLIKLAQDGGWVRARRKLSAAERRELAAERDRRRREREKEVAADEARAQTLREAVAAACGEIWAQHCPALGSSPYLGAKRVGAHGIGFFRQSVVLEIDDQALTCRIHSGDQVRAFFRDLPKPLPEHISFRRWSRGVIAVPLRDVEGRLWALQGISEKGTKLFPKYGRMKGCFHMLGAPVAGQPVAFVEGYATGATVHELTGWCTVVCFNAGNMQAVASGLVPTLPKDVTLLWCTDNDAPSGDGKRAGPDAAEACRARFGGGVLLPEFSHREAA